MEERELLDVLAHAKRVCLLEPPYRRKYPPLGLAKIAAYVKEHGGTVDFGRNYDGDGSHDVVCVTSLFTYDSNVVLRELQQVRRLVPKARVVLGGVFASLMPGYVRISQHGVDLFHGYSRELDSRVPDYGMDWGVDEPWEEFSFTFTSRGCPNRCPYCAVHRLEGEPWVNPDWRDHVVADRPCAMISDNNLSACGEGHIAGVVDFLVVSKKKVVFDNGLDCKHITPGMARQLARLRFTRQGMRVAFDRIGEDGVFQEAVRRLVGAGVAASNIMAYVLFNFNDIPREAHYRMTECVKLGIRPYPQQFVPLNKTMRRDKFVGKHWTVPLVKAFRHYWLMVGIYTKMDFKGFVRGPGARKFPLGREDWEAWNEDDGKRRPA